MEELFKSNKLLTSENKSLKARNKQFIQSLLNIIEAYKINEFEFEGFNLNDQQAEIYDDYTDDPLVDCNDDYSAMYIDDPRTEEITQNGDFENAAVIYENSNQNYEDDFVPEGLSEESDDSGDEYRPKRKHRKLGTDSISITSVLVLNCAVCNGRFNDQNSLDHHMTMVHKNKLSCSDCSFIGRTKQALKYHKTRFHPEISCYECDLCSFTSTQITNFKRHIAEQHKFVPKKCDICAFVAHSSEKLKEHKQEAHLNEFACQECDAHFAFQRELTAHRMTVHPCSKKPVFEREWAQESPCDQCSYVGNSKSALKYHQQVNHSGVEYPCNLCDYVGLHRATIKNHMKKQHPKRVPKDLKKEPPSRPLGALKVEPGEQLPAFRPQALVRPNRQGAVYFKRNPSKKLRRNKCSMCNYSANSGTALKYHMEVNHSGLGYPCSLCDYVGKHRVLIKNHMKRHHSLVVSDESLTVNPLIQCDECDHLANSAESLNCHKEMTHSGLEFPCSVCEFVGKHRKHLKGHLNDQHNIVLSDELMVPRAEGAAAEPTNLPHLSTDQLSTVQPQLSADQLQLSTDQPQLSADQLQLSTDQPQLSADQIKLECEVDLPEGVGETENRPDGVDELENGDEGEDGGLGNEHSGGLEEGLQQQEEHEDPKLNEEVDKEAEEAGQGEVNKGGLGRKPAAEERTGENLEHLEGDLGLEEGGTGPAEFQNNVGGMQGVFESDEINGGGEEGVFEADELRGGAEEGVFEADELRGGAEEGVFESDEINGGGEEGVFEADELRGGAEEGDFEEDGINEDPPKMSPITITFHKARK